MIIFKKYANIFISIFDEKTTKFIVYYLLLYIIYQIWNDLNQLIKISDLNREFC